MSYHQTDWGSQQYWTGMVLIFGRKGTLHKMSKMKFSVKKLNMASKTSRLV